MSNYNTELFTKAQQAGNAAHVAASTGKRFEAYPAAFNAVMETSEVHPKCTCDFCRTRRSADRDAAATMNREEN